MTPEEHRFNALALIFANLQRLMVFHNAVAVSEGKQLDPDLRTELTTQLDLVGEAIQRASETKTVSEPDVEAMRPVVDYLAREIRSYYATELGSDLGKQAAFGAAAVYAAGYLDDGTIQMGRVFGHPEWVDRTLQNKPVLITLRNQANAAVASAARHEFSAEVRGYIGHHVSVALGNREQALAQVDGLPEMLAGRDARQPQ